VQGSHTLKAIAANRKYLIASLIFFGAFFCVLLLRDQLLVVDLAVNSWIPTIHSEGATMIAIAVSYAFDTPCLLVASVAIGGYLFYKNYRSQSLLLLFAMGGNAAIVGFFKTLVASARPLTGLVESTGYSFPSGHTAGSIVFCGLLVYFACHHWKTTPSRISLGITALAGLIILAVGFDRLYLNIHWFSDVLGGCLLGFFWLTFVILISKLLIPTFSIKQQVS